MPYKDKCFSTCKKCGYIPGKVDKCPKCGGKDIIRGREGGRIYFNY